MENGNSTDDTPVSLQHYLEMHLLDPYFRNQIIIYPLNDDTSNVIWIFNSVTSSTTSATAPAPSSASLASSTASASTYPSTSSTGLSTDNKIALATSLPSLFLAILGIYLAYRKRSKIAPALRVMLRNSRASFRRFRVDDATVEMGPVGHEDGQDGGI